jgi:hypothetical protein
LGVEHGVEHNYFLLLILLVFGAIGLIQGEYKLSGYRRVPARFARLMGLVLIAGAVVSYLYVQYAWGYIAIIVALAIGLATMEEIHYPPPPEDMLE